MRRGKFVVVDGIDGVGKGVFLQGLVEAAVDDGKKMYDVHRFWLNHGYHPPLSEIVGNCDVVVTSEPTFVGVGKYIREELTAKNDRQYSPHVEAEAHALDRHILYEQLLLPLLDKGIDVFQSRSFSSSLVYQRQRALDEGRDLHMREILEIPGNAFCYAHPMDFLIVPTIADVGEAVRRSVSRKKNDQSQFENFSFQLKIKPHYESKEFRQAFERIGVSITYMDAGKTVEFSKQQAKTFYKEKLRGK